MQTLYLASVFAHILAAVVWIGGTFFLILVVVPWLRQSGNRETAGLFLRDTGIRFRAVGWWCFAILFVTGLLNLWLRGVRLDDVTDPRWLGTPFGRAVTWKVLLFTAAIAVSSIHDFVVGPRATRAMERDPGGQEARALRRRASRLGRLNALLALGLVFLGVVLVRGWP